MSEELWDIIPSIDCVDEHLQDSFDFYAVRVPGIGRRVQRADLSKLVWSVTRGAVSQKRCLDTLDRVERNDRGQPLTHVTIHQCERIIREIERQECDKFLKDAELFLRQTTRASEIGSQKASDIFLFSSCNLCAPKAAPPE